MLKNKHFIITTLSFGSLFMGMLYISNQHQEKLLAHTIPSSEYTLQHAAIDMEGIHNRLVQSTETLQQVASDFTTLVDRLEEKKQQQLTATAN